MLNTYITIIQYSYSTSSVIEYSEDDTELQHMRDSIGAVNKEIVVPVAMSSSDCDCDRSVHHYIGGKEELDIRELKKELKIESTEEKSLVELSSTVGKLTKAVEGPQKTLSSILTKMFNPTSDTMLQSQLIHHNNVKHIIYYNHQYSNIINYYIISHTSS